MSLCECDCGEDAGVYAADNGHGGKKGQPKRFLMGHVRKGFRATHCIRGHPRTPENVGAGGECLSCEHVWQKTYYDKNVDTIRVKQKAFKQKNPGYDKKYGKKARVEALAAYGNVCACCKESKYEFLCIDHIKGGGSKHRKENNLGGSKIYFWLRRNNYPPGFRVLCHNCNMALGLYGFCPHQKENR